MCVIVAMCHHGNLYSIQNFNFYKFSRLLYKNLLKISNYTQFLKKLEKSCWILREYGRRNYERGFGKFTDNLGKKNKGNFKNFLLKISN